MVPISRADMVSRADLIVRATVLSRTSTWNEDHSQIITLTQLRVQSFLKGSAPTELTLRQFGGEVNDMVSRIEGDAHLAIGQDAVLFLRRGSGVVYLTAMSQSAWLVRLAQDGTPMVARDLHEVTFAIVQPQGGMLMVDPSTEGPESLRHLTDEITALVRGAR